MRHLWQFVWGATLATKLLTSSLGCSTLLAPRAPDSMPEPVRAVYDEIKSDGKRSSRGYTTGIKVGTGKECFSFEIMIDRQHNWEAYVRLQDESQGTTIFQRGEVIGGWVSGKNVERKPLEEQAARDLYRDHVTKVQQAIENGTAQRIYEEPLLRGEIVGYGFKIR